MSPGEQSRRGGWRAGGDPWGLGGEKLGGGQPTRGCGKERRPTLDFTLLRPHKCSWSGIQGEHCLPAPLSNHQGSPSKCGRHTLAGAGLFF